MPRSNSIITAFNAGEVSPLIDGRVDLAKYFHSAKRLENFLVTVQGPAVRRGGTRFVAPIKNEAVFGTILVKFEFNASQFYVLEFGDFYVRFYTQHAQLMSGGVPYEIVSPYAIGHLTNNDGTSALSITQSGDVLYIANQHRIYEPRKLTRFGETDWQFSVYRPNNGPFLEPNSTTTTLGVSALSGSITVTASSAIFEPTDVGRLLRIEAEELISSPPWETNKAYTTNYRSASDGKTYRATNNATSGTSPPVHEHGVGFDGKEAVLWEYENSGYGVVRITAVTSPSTVTADVLVDQDSGLNTLPIELTIGPYPTTRWALGAWSATTEYPRHVAFFRNRLTWAGRQRIWLSVPDDYENLAPDFFGEVAADNAIGRILSSQDVNEIQWIIGAEQLVIGTGGGEFVAGEITTSEPLGPANFAILPQTKKRTNAVRPVAVGSAILYMQRASRKLLSLNYSAEADSYISRDLSVLADRVTRTGVIDLAYQSEPYSILWAITSDGRLRAFTYDQEQDVSGWARHPLGGTGVVAVEAIVCGPTPDGGRDELWLLVRRTINGATRRYIEFMGRPWEGDDEDGTPGDDNEDAYYVDCGRSFEPDPNAKQTIITGLAHLEGATVQVLADGARQPDKVVTGGQITLTYPAYTTQVGFGFVSRLVPMRLEVGGNAGTAQGRMKRISEIVVRFIDTLGGQMGRYGSELDAISVRAPATPMGQPTPPATGDQRFIFPGDYDREGLLEIIQDGPHPMSIASIMPTVWTSE